MLLNSSVNLGDWASKGGKGMDGEWCLSEVSSDSADLLAQGGSAAPHPKYAGREYCENLEYKDIMHFIHTLHNLFKVRVLSVS